MPTTHYVAVIKVGREFRTIPAAPIVGEGDTIIWANYTRDNIEVLLPKVLLGQVTNLKGTSHCGCEKEFSADVIKTPRPGFYPYSVFVEAANDMAVGNSAPGVIIKR